MLGFVLWMGLGCTDAPDAAPQQATSKPDTASVLLISLDTVSAEHLSLYGGRAKVPNLETLAARGTTFDQAISHFPETALSHWSLMTGVLPAVHGNVPASGDSRYRGPTLAERLSARDYRTAAFIGGETLTNRSTGMARGFHTYDDQYPWDRRDLKRPGQQVIATANAWISERLQASEPFFAFVHLFDAHFPYTPSAPWDTAYATGYSGPLTGQDDDLRPYRDGIKTPTKEEIAHIAALYDGELSELDAMLEPILRQVADQNVIVVVTSDHGESFSHNYWFNHRGGLWDEITRVPLIISGPNLPKGERRVGVIGLVDVAPTLLSLTKTPAFEDIHGQDLGGNLARGETADQLVFSITDPWRESPQFAARDAKHKLIAPSSLGMPQLDAALSYDLKKDPAERQPNAPLPDRFESVGAKYQAEIQTKIARWQGPAPERREQSAGEIERLKALGYVDEKEAAQPPR